ncbi:MAG TPA: DedA family protein [Patescibacteria group bacterium]
MTLLKQFIDLFLHIDKNLTLVIHTFGGWSYAIMFLVIFVETGLVVTPFLPGDSLLFAAGALSASTGAFNIVFLWLLMVVAAFLGDTVNYWIGHFVGPKAFEMNSKLFKKEYLDKAQGFYDKHGGKAIILARFVPIVRTFAPFVAGIGKMNYGKFLSFNMIGGFLWVSLFTWGGYLFGNLPIIKNNFHYSVVIIILISLVPIFVEVLKAKQEKQG